MVRVHLLLRRIMQRNDDVDKFFILYGDEEQKMFFEDESVTDIGLAYLFGDVWRIGADENRTEAVTSKLCKSIPSVYY
ncbi:unnamed protein product [Hymenolepis diminuta]|uniref:TerD domain-containing protein n=1 Tax=Hymenolepis diminuta TaxID=6216 RepID=A0A0R3SA46_HYMDI|nr:unnamed protein product [Hymenolepis diminuta]